MISDENKALANISPFTFIMFDTDDISERIFPKSQFKRKSVDDKKHEKIPNWPDSRDFSLQEY